MELELESHNTHQLRKNHGGGKPAHAGGGEPRVESGAVSRNFALGAVSKSDDGVTGVAEVDRDLVRREEVKLLEHGIFARGGSLKRVDLGASGEEGGLTGS